MWPAGGRRYPVSPPEAPGWAPGVHYRRAVDESRRRFVLGAGALGALGAAGAAGVAGGVVPGRSRLRRLLGAGGSDVPDVAEGRVRLVTRRSEERGGEVGFFTAVPAGWGDGRGLPVCLVLHGASYTTADFERLGLARFLTDAAERGTPPFVLAGVDGGRSSWRPSDGSDDPQRLLTDELPGWLDEAGFDSRRRAAFGWSMGGFGALLLAASDPGSLRAVAALSPAVQEPTGEPDTADGRPTDVWSRVDQLDGSSVGIWCGTDDPFYSSVVELADRIPAGPAVAAWGRGGHTEEYWASVTPAAFDFAGHRLAS